MLAQEDEREAIKLEISFLREQLRALEERQTLPYSYVYERQER